MFTYTRQVNVWLCHALSRFGFRRRLPCPDTPRRQRRLDRAVSLPIGGTPEALGTLGRCFARGGADGHPRRRRTIRPCLDSTPDPASALCAQWPSRSPPNHSPAHRLPDSCATPV